MGTQGTGRKRNPNKDRSTAEDDALNLIAREAEARLAAKRAARAEAREIRMKELERQQKEEDSERYSRPSQRHTSISDDDERMSVGSRGSVRSDLDAIGAYGGGGSSSHSREKLKKSKKKKKHKDKLNDRDSNGFDDGYSGISTRSSRLSDESASRVSRSSRLDLQPASYASSDLYGNNGLSSTKQRLSKYNGYESSGILSQISYQRCHRGSLYEDSLYSASRRVTSSRPSEYSSYRGTGSRVSSRASSARASPVDDNCSSATSFLRTATTGLPRDMDHVTIPDLSDEEKDYQEKGARTSSTLSAATLGSLGGSSSRRGSGETSLVGDNETSIREIKEIHELKDQIQDVESKYMQSLKEVKDALVEVEEKYRKAMVSNAQLDNEKNNLMYQVDTLKDSLMELEELLSESRREYEEKAKDLEREKHAHGVLQFQFTTMKETLKQSEELLTEIRQMRLKQDGLVRDISDLQETVEWKDKKIGALERQKEYADAIRNERDELRDEVVQLKDILKKHGIVLGPDLTTNGETLEVGTEGSVSGDSAPQLAQDSQMPPTEGGNGMLGRAQEMELEGRGDKVMEPGRSRQQEDRHEEEAREIKLTLPNPCNLAFVTETETFTEAQPFSTTLVNEVEMEDQKIYKDSDNDITGAVKHGPICDPEVLVVVTASEDKVTGEGDGYKAAGIAGTGGDEVTNKGEMGIKNDKADDAETKVTNIRDDTKEKPSKEPTLESSAADETENLELCREVVKSIDLCFQPRQSVEDIVNNGTQISLGNDLDSNKIEANCETQPEPQKTKAEVLLETNAHQGGKKKRKGKKKKGMTQDDENREENHSSTEKDLVSMKNRTHIPQGTDLDTSESPVESKSEPQSDALNIKNAEALPETTDQIDSKPEPQSEPPKTENEETLPENTDKQPLISQDTDVDANMSSVESKPEPKSEPSKIKNAEPLPEIQPQIPQGTDLDISKSQIGSKSEPQSEPPKTENDETLPENTDKQPPAQGGKKKRKGKKKGEKQGNVKQESKTEKDLASTPADKEPVDNLVEDVVTIEAQQLLEVEIGCLPDRELQIPEETAQNVAEEEWNLKEVDEVAEDERLEVKNKEQPIKNQEIFQFGQAKTEEVVTKKKKKKMKKDHEKPSIESDKSDGETSLLCHGSKIEIADSIDHSKCVISADYLKEELESKTNSHAQTEKLGYTNSPDNFADDLNSSANAECSLGSDLSKPENLNNVKVEACVTPSVEEAETIQETKEHENNQYSPKVLRARTEPEEHIFRDCFTDHTDGDSKNAEQDQEEAGQDEQNESPVEHISTSELEGSLIALSANVEKCNSSSEDNCSSTLLDHNCPAAETLNLPEQQTDLTDCPVADEHLNEKKKQETLDAGEVSNDQVSTETKLSDIETQPQEPAKEIPETIYCFREPGHNESGPCTVVAVADDHIEVKLEDMEDGHKPRPSDEVNFDIEDDENDEGQSFDFDDLDSEISANIQSPVKLGQEVSLTSEGEKNEVEAAGDETKEEDVDKSSGKLLGKGEQVSMVASQQPLEERSVDLQNPEAKSQTIVEDRNTNEEQPIAVQEVINVTCALKDISEEGVSVTVGQQEVETSERLMNANDVGGFPVEEGEEAIQYGSQQGSRGSIQSIEDAAGGDNDLTTMTSLKKGSKKGKGKGKEDCRMS
ncbi:uncharacterized protein lrrfip1a isoform X5 [Esox lucius]|uniref:uncharacterized protein lrrfip1a isoform X5 n=1 Tax=Esox lucius TaxID=8010 RepID=UPI0014772C9E|nr:uncharacterized protein lrrfip1a isoform X5 [Esox lucius]